MVEIYISDISCIEDEDIPRLGMSLLCCERKRHMESFRRIPDKKRTLLATILLEDYLKEKHGICSEYTLEYKGNGKPYIAQLPNLYFNISHSEDLVMLAVCDEEIGADIQIVKELSEAMKGKILAPGEICDNPIETWCAKESYIKYTGRGIAEDMRTFAIDYKNECIVDLNGDTKAMLGNIVLKNDKYYAYICTAQKQECKVFVKNKLSD